jgi:trans-2,3-dihydro-3-hydroxyanthranilate isomerase
VVEFVLEEGVGPVSVRGVKENGRLMFWMTHPEVSFGEVFPHKQVASAIGVEEAAVVHDVPAQIVTTGNPFVFVALRDARAVDSAVSDKSRLEKLLLRKAAYGVFLFAAVGADRLYSRLLAPDLGEDPATGSASGPLGAYAVKYGLLKRAPKLSIVSEQGTKMGRQSFVHIELDYTDATDIPSRIEVGGSVMPVLSGTLSDFA